MVNRLRRRQGGFTLIELLIVVAIIGIIAALLIPNFLDALQKAKQKRTVADERNIGTAMMSRLTDEVAAAAAGYTIGSWGTAVTYTDLATGAAIKLVPQYIQEIPQRDGWKHDYEYYFKIAAPLDPKVMLIRSSGRDTTFTGLDGAFDPTDYDQDIVWADGFFISWPQKLSSGT